MGRPRGDVDGIGPMFLPPVARLDHPDVRATAGSGAVRQATCRPFGPREPSPARCAATFSQRHGGRPRPTFVRGTTDYDQVPEHGQRISCTFRLIDFRHRGAATRRRSGFCLGMGRSSSSQEHSLSRIPGGESLPAGGGKMRHDLANRLCLVDQWSVKLAQRRVLDSIPRTAERLDAERRAINARADYWSAMRLAWDVEHQAAPPPPYEPTVATIDRPEPGHA